MPYDSERYSKNWLINSAQGHPIRVREQTSLVPHSSNAVSTRVVHGPAQARKPGQAKPYLSQAKPGQTIWPGGAFGPAQGFLKPKPSRKAPARRDSTLADKGGNRLEDVKENMYCLL